MGTTAAPDTLLRLVDRFDRDRKVFLSGDYKEEQLRAEFLNPRFETLGWDVNGRRGCGPSHRQVVGGRQLFSSLSST
jgi:hypothetical protein